MEVRDEKLERETEHQMRVMLKGAVEVVGAEELRVKVEQSIRTGEPLRVKFGMDPSAPDIHLGHAVVLRKLKQMQDMGHRIMVVIGDVTARIGDPTGKSKGRKALSDKEVMENAQTYLEQIFQIMDREKTEVYYNGEWLELLKLEEILHLASTVTVARLLERDDFQNRYKNNVPIGLHEFFYPLMQAYDSVAIGADIELGGTDQTFNILMGRNLQKSQGLSPQAAIFMPLLVGLDGVEKMSKSLNNYIGVKEDAKVMFKKVMEVPDALIIRYFELATDEMPERIDVIKEELASGKNPRDVKLELAEIITGLYHGKEETERARNYYQEAFGRKENPEDVPDLEIPWECSTLRSLLPIAAAAGLGFSSSELRRITSQGGVRINGTRADSLEVQVADGDVLKIGKKHFLKLRKTP
mgnify:CR=1 FL=1